MPTIENVLSPFTIIGNGRSGTSLVSRVFAAHPDCTFCGETVNLVHSVYRSLESSLPQKKHSEIPDVIRHQFLKLFAKQSRYWMHKPIGIPIVAQLFPSEDEFETWFWQVLGDVFPQAKFFTVLRHPYDVVISSKKWWGYSYESIVESNRRVARLITHPDSRVDYAVNYHEMIQNPRAEVMRLFEYLDIPFHEDCMRSFEQSHVVSGSGVESKTELNANALQKKRDSGFSHNKAWEEIGNSVSSASFRQATDDCWSKYGHDFGGWPT